MIDLNKYKFVERVREDGVREVVAISTFAKKTVKGVAKCNPNDEYYFTDGMVIAAARCNEKIAKKRLDRAHKKYLEALDACVEAQMHFIKMSKYFRDADKAYDEAVALAIQIVSEN